MSKPYLLVLYYSRHGATRKMAQLIARGIELAGNMEARIRTVAPVSTVAEATVPAVPSEGDIYCSAEDLRYCAGMAVGSPTRFGNMAAPMKYFWDSTVTHWINGDLINKPAGVFTSTGSMHGGQESTLLTMMLPLLHHGMIIAGLPYSAEELHTTTSGGTPYGPSHVAGTNASNPISTEEANLCRAFGQRLASIASKLND